MKSVISVLLVMFFLYLLALRGRRGHPEMEKLQGWYYAHRGLHDAERPENSMAAFRAALDSGFGIELDLHLLKDGNLAVMHDSALKRTTGAEGKIEDLTTAQLRQYHLEETGETIPAFRQVLELFDGRAPMIIELKTDGDNYAELCRKACEIMQGYKGAYCMESFDPRCIRWLKKNQPDVIRGQLASNFLRSKNSRKSPVKVALAWQLLNFWTSPDFVAYKYADSHHLSNWIVRRIWGVQGAAWTLRTREEFDRAVADDWLPIFENFIP